MGLLQEESPFSLQSHQGIPNEERSLSLGIHCLLMPVAIPTVHLLNNQKFRRLLQEEGSLSLQSHFSVGRPHLENRCHSRQIHSQNFRQISRKQFTSLVPLPLIRVPWAKLKIIIWAYTMKIRRNWGSESENIHIDTKKLKNWQLGSSVSYKKTISGSWIWWNYYVGL